MNFEEIAQIFSHEKDVYIYRKKWIEPKFIRYLRGRFEWDATTEKKNNILKPIFEKVNRFPTERSVHYWSSYGLESLTEEDKISNDWEVFAFNITELKLKIAEYVDSSKILQT